MRFTARIFGFLFAFLLVFFVSKTSFAQTNTQSLPTVTPIAQDKLGPYAQKVLIEVMGAMGCQLAGINPVNQNQPCLATDPKTGEMGFMQNKGGLLGFAGGMIVSLYTPPIHTADYFNYLAGNFGISKSANAQNFEGVGLTTIAPIAGLWEKFRNLVYLFFVIIFVLIGLGIMLRVRIDPRTVMTIQNQIPKIIIGIILVTLSFPIAGFLIDLMWVVILIVINFFAPLKPLGYGTPFSIISVVPGGILGVAKDTGLFVGNTIFSSGFSWDNVQNIIRLPSAQCQDIFCFMGNIIQAVLGTIIGFFLGIIIGLLAFFVVVIALLYTLFKLWFELLKAYISILMSIIFAPFWIVAGLIPGAGEKAGFGAWVRDMLGNLMAFPAAVGMFFLAATFLNLFSGNVDTFFIPPLVGAQEPNYGAVIAFGILLMTPSVVKMTKAAFKSPQIGFGTGGGIGAGQAIVGGAIGGGLSRTFRMHTNPTTGEKVAVGAGARFLERKVKLPIARKILGFNAEQQSDRVNTVSTPTGIRPKNMRRQGGSTPPPAPPTQGSS